MAVDEKKRNALFNDAKEFYNSYLGTIERHGFFPTLKPSDIKKRGELEPELASINVDSLESEDSGSCGLEERGTLRGSPFGIYQYDYNFAQWGAWSNSKIG